MRQLAAIMRCDSPSLIKLEHAKNSLLPVCLKLYGPVGEARASAEWLRPSLYLDQDFRELRLAEQAREEVCPRRREESAAASSTLDEITQGHLGLLLSNRSKHVMVMGIKS